MFTFQLVIVPKATVHDVWNTMADILNFILNYIVIHFFGGAVTLGFENLFLARQEVSNHWGYYVAEFNIQKKWTLLDIEIVSTIFEKLF